MAQKSSVISGLGRVDTHHHFLSSASSREERPAQKGDLILSAGRDALPSSPKDHLKYMDQNSIQTAVLSFTIQSGFARLPAKKLLDLCEAVWADQQKYVLSNPLRFGSFAMLPVPHMEETLKFIEQIKTSTIPPDGFTMPTSVGDLYLGDEYFDPLWAVLDKTSATVFVHPIDNSIPPKLKIPIYVLEFTFDTARCLLSLIVSGTLTRYPNIRFIFSHNGGAYPYIAHRTSLIEGLVKSNNNGLTTTEIISKSNVYFDTALAHETQFSVVKEIGLPVERILYGSDFPYTAIGESKAYLMASEAPMKSEALSTEDWEVKIARENALSLFPRLKQVYHETFRNDHKL